MFPDGKQVTPPTAQEPVVQAPGVGGEQEETAAIIQAGYTVLA